MAILRQIAQLGQLVLRTPAHPVTDPLAPAVREEEYADFLACVFQHEFDHMQGLVFLDRVESTRELTTEKEYLRSLRSRD